MRNTSLFWLMILRLNCFKFSYGTFSKAIIILFYFLIFGCPGSSMPRGLFFFSPPLVSVSRGCSVVAACGILTAVASLTVERILENRLGSCGTWP